MNTVNLVYVEDFLLEREAIIKILSEYPEFTFVNSFSNGLELLEWMKFNEKILPDIILLDINMKVMNGRETFQKIRKKYRSQKIIMLSEHFTDEYVIEFMTNGANGFLSKNARPQTIAETIRRVQDYGFCIDPLISNILAKKGVTVKKALAGESRPDLDLSVHRINVLRCMLKGMKTDDIARELNGTYKGIEHTRADIWKVTKCEKNNYPQLMEFAFKHGLVSF